MESTIRLWIIFNVFCFGLSEDISQKVDALAKNLEKYLNELKKIMTDAIPEEQVKKANSTLLTEADMMKILTNSKIDSEKIVNKTNAAVDNIQQKLTQEFNEYSQTPPKKYKLECATNDSFIFYYRAKALKINSSANLTNCIIQTLPLEKDPYLGNIVTNRETATSHVPTNVYDASQEIQSVANWTTNLDQTFQLYKDDSQLKWQFFCSNTGLFKIYPGIRWNLQIEDSDRDSSLVDFFDCRSEQWYLEATSYPKKMMIMVDKSGSMKGRRRIIANHTIYEILNTLTENDFFNILLFTKEYCFADNTTSGILMQATDKNKKYILDQLATVFIPDGIAEYDFGLNESFRVLRNDKMNNSDSKYYNYLLMIITDGSPMDYQQLIVFNNKDIDARIFTYLIGQGTTEREYVTNMACKNQGYAVEIATLADVKENVQKYLNVVARRNALMRNAFNVWTGVHKNQMQPTEEIIISNNTDTTFMPLIMNPSAASVTFAPNITATFATSTAKSFLSNTTINVQPLQMTKIEIFEDKPIDLFVTASKAVFDETNATANWDNGILLGAVGIDIPISEFVKTAPFWKIGVNAYLFGVTSNGFVLFHPKYAPQYKKHVKYFYRNVDISELEIDSNTGGNIKFIRNDQTVQTGKTDQLRKSILSSSDSVRNAGSLKTLHILDDFKTAFNVERNYFIAGIKDTSYKFGLAVPINQKVPQYPDELNIPLSDSKFYEDFGENLETLRNSCKLIFSEKNEMGTRMKNHEFCTLNPYIASLQMQGPLCVLIEVFSNKSTYNDCIKNKESAKEYLKNIYMEMKTSKNVLKTWPVIKKQSIQQIFSFHHFGLIRYYNYETLTYPHFITNHSLGIEDPLYQETVLMSQSLKSRDVLLARPLPSEVVKKNLAKSSLIFTVTTPINSLDGDIVGIIGIQAKYNEFFEVLIKDGICNETHQYECYVLTESGLILLNNMELRHNGDPLTEVDCALMENLVNNGIFKPQPVFDFQALCPNPSKQAESFSNRLLNPFTQIFRLLVWLIYEFWILMQNFSISNIISSISAQEEQDPHIDISTTGFPGISSKSLRIEPMSKFGNSLSGILKESPEDKQKHELNVRNKLREEIKHCAKNHYGNDNELSGCIQKAVSNICRLDKTHSSTPSDQHIDKMIQSNKISHCETACNILRSEYPKVWQDQDDCKVPQKLCHKFIPTFGRNFQPIKVNQIPPTLKVSETENEERLRYKRDVNSQMVDSKEFPSNGTFCVGTCVKKWFAKQINNTNLLLVVVEKSNAACTCDCRSEFGKPRELKRMINQSIENPFIEKPEYFQEFVNFTKKENSSVCSDDTFDSQRPHFLLMAMSIFLSVFVVAH